MTPELGALGWIVAALLYLALVFTLRRWGHSLDSWQVTIDRAGCLSDLYVDALRGWSRHDPKAAAEHGERFLVAEIVHSAASSVPRAEQ